MQFILVLKKLLCYIYSKEKYTHTEILMTNSPIQPNIPAQLNLASYGIYSVGFSTSANKVFTYSGDITPDFLTDLENSKTFAQSLNELLPQLIAALNAYPTQP
jgi:hypothetical protein